MGLKERIDLLNKKNKIDSYVNLLIRIYRIIGNCDPYEQAEKQKSNFTQMLNGKRPLNKDYYIPLEKIYGVTMDYILNGGSEPDPTYTNKGLRYTASTNNYSEFVKLGSEETEGSLPVIFNSDEYNKSIFDYIAEYGALEGIRYLCRTYNLRYDLMRKSFYAQDLYCMCSKEAENAITDKVFETDDYELFIMLFSPYDILQCYEGEKTIYDDEEFIKKILKSEKIFKSQLQTLNLSIKKANYTQGLNDEQESLYINPILNKLLSYGLDHYEEYGKQVDSILYFGLEENKKVIDWINSKIDFGKYFEGLNIDKDGNIIYRTYYKYGHLINPGEVIDPDMRYDLKIVIEKINEINNSINYTDSIDFFGDNHKKTKLNKEGHLLKLASKNEIEYQIHDYFNDKIAPIPHYYGMKEGVDEFDDYRGKPVGRGYTIEHLKEIAKFLRKFQDTKYPALEGKEGVYIHGDIDLNNFYFTGNELTDVVNWDNARIGTYYDDMIMLILNYSGMSDLHRNNKKVLENVKEIFDAYGASDNYRNACIGFLRLMIESAVNRLDETHYAEDEATVHEYEGYLWCLSFVKTFFNELQKQ